MPFLRTQGNLYPTQTRDVIGLRFPGCRVWEEQLTESEATGVGCLEATLVLWSLSSVFHFFFLLFANQKPVSMQVVLSGIALVRKGAVQALSVS